MFERQLACRAFSRAWAKTGNRIAARIAIIAITTRSSMRVNARPDGCRRRARAKAVRRMPGPPWPIDRAAPSRVGVGEARSAREQVLDVYPNLLPQSQKWVGSWIWAANKPP